MPKKTILVVECDPSMLDFYRVIFEFVHSGKNGWIPARSGEEALRVARRAPASFDAVILDWGLPDMDGLVLAARLRAVTGRPNLPLLMVSARGDAAERTAALEAGVDDYLSKPVDAGELMARLRKMLGRQRSPPVAPPPIRGLRVDSETGCVIVGGRMQKLFPKELDLLLVFLRRPNRVLPLAYLWEAVWGYESENRDNSLEAAISNLRRKLGPTWPRRLETFRGKGYRLNLE